MKMLALVLAAVLPACAPVFSDIQSARLVGRGQVDVTPSVTTTSFTDPDTTAHVQTHFGVQVAMGASDFVDLRLRYENVKVTDDGPTVSVASFGPKIQLVKNHVAAFIPLGFAFGTDVEVSESWQLHPTLLMTAALHPSAELNLSAKYLIPFGEDQERLWAFNFGLGLGPNLDRWVIRPEIGFLVNPGEEGHFTQLSLGLTLKLN